MAKNVKAALKHYSSTLEHPQHEDCPSGVSSWCSYQRDLATNQNSHCPVKNPIPPSIQKIISPVFEKLGNEQFLDGCKNLLSSNANESFHHVLWGLAPKEQYNSPKETELAMNIAVCLFNNGFTWTYKTLLSSCNLSFSSESINIFTSVDSKRIANAEYFCMEAVRMKRKKIRKEKSRIQDAFVHEEGTNYSSGKFHG